MKFTLIIHWLLFWGVPSVMSFSWQTCGSKTDLIKVASLDISSNGTDVLYITGRGKVGMNITSPIQMNLKVFKKFFWGWTFIPCVEEVGSCLYNDVCSLSPYKLETCPNDFITNGLPCKCPVAKGQYIVKKFPIHLSALPEWIEKGKYKLQITLKKDSTELLCLSLVIDL